MRKRIKRVILSILGFITLSALIIIFPVQKKMAIFAFHRYLSVRQISDEEVCSIVVNKEIKMASGGYNMAVKFCADMDLVYKYQYSLINKEFWINNVFYNPNSELAGGVSVVIEGIIPLYEKQYYAGNKIMDYSFSDFWSDLIHP